jgi:hypothetical protein
MADKMAGVGGAWIAVVGTLCGVMVTAMSGLLSGVLAARRQRTDAEWQAALNVKDQRRQELRDTFVDYLACYGALRDRILVFHRLEATELRRGDSPFLIESFAPDEATAFKRATHLIMITASAATSNAASLAAFQLWDVAAAAERRDSDRFTRELDAGSLLRRELYHAMRSELGLDGTLAYPPAGREAYFVDDWAPAAQRIAASGDDQEPHG